MQEILEQGDAADTTVVAQANHLINYYKGRHLRSLPAAEYADVLCALHPDTTTPELRDQAFKLMETKKLLLTDEGGSFELRSSWTLGYRKYAWER